VDGEASARAWVDGWSRGWPARDPEVIASLYTEDSIFLSHPFREAKRGGAGAAEYASWVFEDQADVEFRFGDPIASGDRAAVDWWAVITAHDGAQGTLAGVSLLRFDEDGRVREQRDTWVEEPGRIELPGWARP
jgi:ketosteroid isomerase-like protein